MNLIYSPRKNFKKRRILGFFVLAAFFILLGTAFAFYEIVRDLPNPGRITDRVVTESTKIFDRTGKVLLYEIHGEEKRTIIPLEEIPETVKEAAIVAEDINFY